MPPFGSSPSLREPERIRQSRGLRLSPFRVAARSETLGYEVAGRAIPPRAKVVSAPGQAPGDVIASRSLANSEFICSSRASSSS